VQNTPTTYSLMFPLPQATLVSRKKMIGVMEPSAGQIEVSQKEKKNIIK